MARKGPDRPRGKSIFDPVHGPIPLGPAELDLLSTPEFQRLWGVRQTGFAHLVFPGANHTRLEHSLGTHWVADRMAERLGVEEGVRPLVSVAGLLHDLGHPPFSHTLDGPLREVLGVRHETLSRQRILGTDRRWPEERTRVPALLERHGLDPRRVADLVDPRRPRPAKLPFAVLHGAIDADRIDYLQRDAHYTGVAHGAIDAVRLLDTLRAQGGRLVFAEKGRSAVEGFLVGRALMYSALYYHKTVRAAEMMAQGAVERVPGYPSAAEDLFALRDGELLARLSTVRSPVRQLVSGLLDRRLHKRVAGERTVGARARARWMRLAEDPPLRRALEDGIAERLRAPEGSVLIDLAGLAPRLDPADDWSSVGLVEDGRIERPFRPSGLWGPLAARPPSDWAVSVYVAPRYRPAAPRVGRALERLAP